MFQAYTLRAQRPMCSTKLNGQNSRHERDQDSSSHLRSGLFSVNCGEHAVAQLAEALSYTDIILLAALWPWG